MRLLIIPDYVLDRNLNKLRVLQTKVEYPSNHKLIEDVINDLNRNSIDLYMSIERGSNQIRGEM